MHEAMHALGVNHVYSSTASFLVEPTITTGFDGPQLDDILGMQRLYGDALEKNGGNNSYAAATALGALAGEPDDHSRHARQFDSRRSGGGRLREHRRRLGHRLFQLHARAAIGGHARPNAARERPTRWVRRRDRRSSFNTRLLSDLSLTLFDSSGTMQIGSTANANGAGGGETIVTSLAAGTYYARVTGAQNDVQLYQIGVTAVAASGADFNEDGFVDGDDLTAWWGEFGRRRQRHASAGRRQRGPGRRRLRLPRVAADAASPDDDGESHRRARTQRDGRWRLRRRLRC